MSVLGLIAVAMFMVSYGAWLYYLYGKEVDKSDTSNH